MRVYLDANIFAYLELGKLTVTDLENIVDAKIDRFFFSAAHINELIETTGADENERLQRIKSRLETIKTVTKCNYLNEHLDKIVYESIESPFEVLNTIGGSNTDQSWMKSFANILTHKQKEDIRNAIGIEPKRMNNYSSAEIISHLNKKLITVFDGMSFLEMIEHGISFNPNSATFGRSERIAAIFDGLDIFGYWKDKATEKSNYARFWDSNHTFYASYCDCFITDDKRTTNKAQVIYNLYNIGTKILKTT